MKPFKLILVIALLIVLAGCNSGAPVNLEVEKNNLMHTDNEFAHLSGEKGAALAFRAYVAENALLLPDRGMPIKGRNDIFEWMKGANDAYSLVWEVLGVNVAESADMGWTWGEWRFTGPNQNGETVQVFGKYLFVWQKIKGEWKVVADIRNSNPAEQSTDNG